VNLFLVGGAYDNEGYYGMESPDDIIVTITKDQLDSYSDTESTPDCKCRDNMNKDLIQSLKSCTDAVDAIKTCSPPSNIQRPSPSSLASCPCGEDITKALIESLSSCTDVLLTDVTGCSGDGLGGPLNPIKPPPKTESSCNDILSNHPQKKSGYYNIKVGQKTIRVYCLMGTLCGENKGWTRFGQLDMTKDVCPNSLQMYETNKIRHCGRKYSGNGGCGSVTMPSNGIKYKSVCGRVFGMQYYTTEGFCPQTKLPVTIDSPYLDGVSITHGTPRQHIFSLASGKYETRNKLNVCPCNKITIAKYRDMDSPPKFVGSDYFCESGNDRSRALAMYYTKDILWDNEGCHSMETPCCANNKHPGWFYKKLAEITDDSIELRVCTDQGTSNEKVTVTKYDIYAS
jgi:hypothetical protein